MMETKVTKYCQIKQDIVEAIKLGKLKADDKVDSESILKKKYGVSATTVRKAFSDLINEGYLYGVQGVGTFVAKKHMIRKLTSISFSDELLQQGYDIDMDIDEIEEIVSKAIAEKLGIPKEQFMICVKRLRIANGEPIAYQCSYIDSRKLSLEEAQDMYKTKSFYRTLANYKIKPTWVNENYSIKDVNNAKIEKLMRIKNGSSTFFVKRLAFDELDNVIEYSETYFNKDWYSVTVNIKEL